MSNTPPDILSIHPDSPHFDGAALERGIGIKFRGAVRTDVEEYSIPEGWIRVQAGKTRDRRGRPLLIKLNGPVEAWFEDAVDSAETAQDSAT